MENSNYNQSFQDQPKTDQPSQAEENLEIDLWDYLHLLNKRKKGIIGIFLVVVIVAVLVNLYILSETYEAKSLVKVGLFRGENIESLEDIKLIFSSDNTLKEIAQRLDLPEGTNLSRGVANIFDLQAGDGSGFLHVKGRGETPEKALMVVNVVDEILLARHDGLFEQAGKTFEAELTTLQKDREKVGSDIEQLEQTIIPRLEEDIKFYDKEIRARANVTSYAQGRLIETYANLLSEAKSQKEDKEHQILELKQKLVVIDQALQQKEFEKAYETRSTNVEVPPVLPDTKIGPPRRRNVMIAGVFALFVGILWAFVAEYWRNKQRKIVAKID